MADVEKPRLEPADSGGVDALDRESDASTDPAADQAALAVAAPELAAGSLSEYWRALLARARAGESGVLPVVVGLLLIAIIFQSQNENFLTAGNLVNLLTQGAAFMLLGMGEVFALLLGEIDLSIGFVSGIGGVVTTKLLIGPYDWPWWAAILAALLVTTAIGLFQGTLITRLGLPSFVVTLAGLLGFQGVMIWILGEGGTYPIPSDVVNGFANGNMTPATSWIVMGAVVGMFAVITIRRDTKRRSSGLVAPPASLVVVKIVLVAAAGIALVLICNTDRGALVPISGVPWVVLIVLGVLGAWSFLLGRTRFGRYVYAIGSNPEAARRAGINLARIRTISFGLASLTAGIAGIVYASRLRSVSTSLDGGTLVLYAIASAVIGGTSLFGGRGKPLHAVLGGLVIAAIYNGMGLLGMSAATQYMVTAVVLLAAATVDAVARRGRSTTQR
jgi:D-xylose transport system permease protein